MTEADLPRPDRDHGIAGKYLIAANEGDEAFASFVAANATPFDFDPGTRTYATLTKDGRELMIDIAEDGRSRAALHPPSDFSREVLAAAS